MEATNQVSNINIYITALPHTLRGSLSKASLQPLMRETKVIIKSRPLAAEISKNKQPVSAINLSWTFMIWFYKNSCPSNRLIILWGLTSFKLELSSGGLLLVRKRNHWFEFMLVQLLKIYRLIDFCENIFVYLVHFHLLVVMLISVTDVIYFCNKIYLFNKVNQNFQSKLLIWF